MESGEVSISAKLIFELIHTSTRTPSIETASRGVGWPFVLTIATVVSRRPHCPPIVARTAYWPFQQEHQPSPRRIAPFHGDMDRLVCPMRTTTSASGRCTVPTAFTAAVTASQTAVSWTSPCHVRVEGSVMGARRARRGAGVWRVRDTRECRRSPRVFSYSALLRRRDGMLGITVEHVSSAPDAAAR